MNGEAADSAQPAGEAAAEAANDAHGDAPDTDATAAAGATGTAVSTAAGEAAGLGTEAAPAMGQPPGSEGAAAAPHMPPLESAPQQSSKQRSEPDWFVGGRNGDDGYASCAPGRSFAASKASLMGNGSQGSR